MTMPLGLAGWIAMHGLLAAICTWWVRRYALGRNLLDAPGDRRSHKVATPRGGGLSIVVTILVALLWLAVISPSSRGLLLAATLGLLLVAGVGWADDHRPLPAWSRLAVHLLAATVLALALWYAGHGTWAALAALAAVPVLVNIWNFMDGIDGLAASQAAIAAGAYALLSHDPVITALAWSLSAACLGFLPFNFPRARIFLGDVGSGALGYLLAFLIVWTGSRIEPDNGPSTWLLLLLPASAFLIDASLTLARRILRGEPWWKPHLQHLYQSSAYCIGKHWPVTLCFAVWAVGSGGLLLTAAPGGRVLGISLALGWFVAASVLWFGLQGVLMRNKKLKKLRKP